jgi:hypothetical protein
LEPNLKGEKMRLKIKKLLRAGEYHISFENVDFNEEETTRIEKFGMPFVDFSSDGLGTRRLDEINLSLKCQAPEDAEEVIGKTKQIIKDKLTELLSQVDNFSGEEMVEI